MADLRRQPAVWVVPVVLVIAVVAAVFLLGGTDGSDGTDGTDDAAGPSGSTSSTASPVAPTTKAEPDAWCAAFLAFADAQAQYVGDPDNPEVEADFQAKADALLALGQPLGLSPGGVTALQVLVDGALLQAGDPTVSPDSAPQDDQAFAAYLQTTCPA